MLGVLDSLANEYLYGFNVHTENVIKPEDQSLIECMQFLVEDEKPDLIVVASESLCEYNTTLIPSPCSPSLISSH